MQSDGETIGTLIMLAASAAGAVIALVWLAIGVLALRRLGQSPDEARGAGTGMAMIGAAAGVAMGVVTGCGGLWAVAGIHGAAGEPSPWFALFLLAFPVGLVVCPGFVLWGTVRAWQIAERLPDDDVPPAAGFTTGAATDAGSVDPLDAPFAPAPPQAEPGADA